MEMPNFQTNDRYYARILFSKEKENVYFVQ